MLCENIKDFSIKELERVLLPCVGGKKLFFIAIKMIENKTLTYREFQKLK